MILDEIHLQLLLERIFTIVKLHPNPVEQLEKVNGLLNGVEGGAG